MLVDGHESEWTPGVDDGQGGLACCDSWGGRVGHDWATELNWPMDLRGLENGAFHRCCILQQTRSLGSWKGSLGCLFTYHLFLQAWHCYMSLGKGFITSKHIKTIKFKRKELVNEKKTWVSTYPDGHRGGGSSRQSTRSVVRRFWSWCWLCY